MREWQPITTAPKNGQIVKLRNEFMSEKETYVYGKWGEYRPEWLSPYKRPYESWVLVRDPNKVLLSRPGTVIFPNEWAEVDGAI